MHEPPTRNLAKKGFSGMGSSSPASSSVCLDNEVLCNPYQTILPNVCVLNQAKEQKGLGAVQEMEDF